MLPPRPGSSPLKTRQVSACCLRFGSGLLASASLTRAITASKSATLSGLMTLKMMPESEVNLREAGTAAAGAAAGACGAAGGVAGAWNANGKREPACGLAERREAQLAEAGRERISVALPHVGHAFGALLFRRHRAEQHVEQLVLGVRHRRLDVH